jgi:signal transduction histidine kinase/ligand-binding sensor domain-containing protein
MKSGYRYQVTLCVMAIIAFVSCKQNREVPFPSDESNFARPQSRSFSFSTPQQIIWKVTDPDSIKPLPVTHFNFNKLPSRPFDISEARPLRKPMSEANIDWHGVKDTVFKLKNLPTHKLKYRTVFTGTPKIVKAGVPTFKPGTTRGLMQLGPEMGMPAFSRCFLQDADGLMWIGTDHGLYRYDGQTFKIYGAEQGLTDLNLSSIIEDNQHNLWIAGFNSVHVLNREAGFMRQVLDTLCGPEVYSMMKDKHGNIWMTTRKYGIIIIDPENETISKYDTGSGLNNNFTIRSIQDTSGLIWIATRNGINIVDIDKGVSRKLQIANGIKGEGVYAIEKDRHGKIWIGTDSGVNVLDANGKKIRYLGKEQGLIFNRLVSEIRQDPDGLIWIGTFDGKLYTLDEGKGLLESFELAPDPETLVYNIFTSSDGQVWIGTVKGPAYVFNPGNGRPGNFNKVAGLGNNQVWDLLEDTSGQIWIGTYKGIDIYDPRAGRIKHLDTDQGLLYDRNTMLCEAAPGEIWATGNAPAISIINIDKGTIRKLSATEGLPEDFYSSILKDDSGRIWIGSNLGNIIVVDLRNKLIKSFTLAPGSERSTVFNLRQTSNGKIWAGTFGAGVFVIDPVINTVSRLSVAEGLINNQVTTFMENINGEVWIGSEGGIDIANSEQKTLTSITSKQGLASRGVYTIDRRDSSIYVGTSNGLTIFPDRNFTDSMNLFWKSKTYGKAQGLAFVDFAQNSSLVTRNGLYLAGVEDTILTVFNSLKKQRAVSKTYVTGINVMDKAQRFGNSLTFERQIRKVDTLWKPENTTYYQNKMVSPDSTQQVNANIKWDSTAGYYSLPVKLQLPYDQNYLSFTFNGTHLNNPDKATYRYILEGIDKNWSPISSNTISENYRDLPQGDYTFKVSSAGFDGVWSDPAEFKFSIIPPFWKTWWAYTLYILVAAFLIWSLAKFRLRSLELQNRQLEEKVTRRTEALNRSLSELKSTQSQLIHSEKMASLGELTAGIAHEIQNPLNFVNNFAEVNAELIDELQEEIDKGNLANAKMIANDIGDNEQKVKHHGKRAEAIVRSMLQHSRTGTLQKEPTDVNVLADEYFRLSFHGLRAKDKTFNATMQTDFQPDLGLINLRSQDIGRVLLNLYNNAFYAVSEKMKSLNGSSGEKYEPRVWVSTKAIGSESQNGTVMISVKDNGNGISSRVVDKIFHPFFTTKPTGEGTGLGLSLAYDIIKSHGGSLTVETKEGQYTEFQILLPKV